MPSGSSTSERRTLTVAGGQTESAFRLTGPGAITAIRVKMDFENRAAEMAALRELCLQVRFDGQQQPAVWCPLGDFFGTAPGKNLYQSYPTGMTEDGFYAYWYMPFARSAEVELVNDGSTPRTLELEIVKAPLDRDFARSEERR